MTWFIPPGASAPDRFSPFTEGTLKLSTAGTTPGATIVGTFSGVYGDALSPTDGDGEGADPGTTPLGVGLVINEVAAKGDPQDWFELHNTSSDRIALDGFELADSLTDAAKRVAFPAGTIIQPGAYMQFSLDKDGWPGFALGGRRGTGHLAAGRHAHRQCRLERGPVLRRPELRPRARRHRRFPNRGQPHPGRRQPALEEQTPAGGRPLPADWPAAGQNFWIM